jgi:hypothetical protein
MIVEKFKTDGGGQVRKLEYPEKTTDLSQIAEKLYHIMLHRVHIAMNAVMGTACISSSKSTYHTITTTTAPLMYI